MNRKQRFVNWAKEHKTEIIITGVGASVLLVLGICLKNEKSISNLYIAHSEKTISSIKAVQNPNPSLSTGSICTNITPSISAPDNKIPFSVIRHIRNLPEGWHASQEKISAAIENSITLQGNQTWVETYTKGNHVA